MHPLNKTKLNTISPSSSRLQGNTGGATSTSVSQLRNASHPPEGMQQAPGPQIADRHFTRLMRLMNRPQTVFTQGDLDSIAMIQDPKNQELVLQAIVSLPNLSEAMLAKATKRLQALQEARIYSKNYTEANIWEAYTDAHKIHSPEKQAEFLKRILQSHIDMKAFHQTDFPKFKDLIKDFEKPIQEELYLLIVDTVKCGFLRDFATGLTIDASKCGFELQILALKETNLSLYEKEVYLCEILVKLSGLRFSENKLKFFHSAIKDFPKHIQNNVYIQFAKDITFDSGYKLKFDALKLLDMPLLDKKKVILDVFSDQFLVDCSSLSKQNALMQFLNTCHKELRSDLCVRIAQHDSFTSPFRMAVVALMEANPEKDRVLAHMTRSPFFKFEDKVKLARFISDVFERLQILEEVLVNNDYSCFMYSNKYDAYDAYPPKDLGMEGFVNDRERFEMCNQIIESDFNAMGLDNNIVALKVIILERFFEARPPIRMSDFYQSGIFNEIFISGSVEEKKVIMLNFAKLIYDFDGDALGFNSVKLALLDRFNLFYEAQGWDQDTKKAFILNLLGNNNCPRDFQEYVLRSYLEKYTQEADAPNDGILMAIAQDNNISMQVRHDILRTFVEDQRLLEDILFFTEKANIEEIRFRKMKGASPH